MVSIRKLDSLPVKNSEIGQFIRKCTKVSPPPKSEEPFSEVYESEIEFKEELMMISDEQKQYDPNNDLNESVNTINELIDSISQTTPIRLDGINSIDVR